jgi:hypothetical protein
VQEWFLFSRSGTAEKELSAVWSVHFCLQHGTPNSESCRGLGAGVDLVEAELVESFGDGGDVLGPVRNGRRTIRGRGLQ